MGFSLGAILSNKNNRNLQRKQSGLGKNGLIGKGFSGQKAPVDEVKMEKIANRSLWVEIAFYTIILCIVFAGVYFWVG